MRLETTNRLGTRTGDIKFGPNVSKSKVLCWSCNAWRPKHSHLNGSESIEPGGHSRDFGRFENRLGVLDNIPPHLKHSNRRQRGSHLNIQIGENMATKIFVNLPVKNLMNSVDFFTKLGFTFDPKFTDETAACMVVAEDIFVMLLTEAKFRTFTPKQICDAPKSTEVLVCLSAESREGVNETVRKAVAAGGNTYNEPQDHGFMYGHGFQDLDGHIWE